MQTLHFKRTAAVAGFIALAGWILLTSSGFPNAGVLEKKSDIKFGKAISASQLLAAIKKSTHKKIVINIYPVKLSDNVYKNDFKIMIVLQDAVAHGKNLGDSLDEVAFKKEATSYIKYLKGKGILKSGIPYGYYIEATPLFLKNISSLFIEISMNGKNQNADFCKIADQLSRKKGSDDEAGVGSDPSSCMNEVTYRLDSSGKCPPCLLLFDMAYQLEMKQIIKNTYKHRSGHIN